MEHLTLSADTIHLLDQWLSNNCKGPYNLDAWVTEAEDRLNNMAPNDAFAVVELRAWESTIGQTLSFQFVQ